MLIDAPSAPGSVASFFRVTETTRTDRPFSSSLVSHVACVWHQVGSISCVPWRVTIDGRAESTQKCGIVMASRIRSQGLCLCAKFSRCRKINLRFLSISIVSPADQKCVGHESRIVSCVTRKKSNIRFGSFRTNLSFPSVMIQDSENQTNR